MRRRFLCSRQPVFFLFPERGESNLCENARCLTCGGLGRLFFCFVFFLSLSRLYLEKRRRAKKKKKKKEEERRRNLSILFLRKHISLIKNHLSPFLLQSPWKCLFQASAQFLEASHPLDDHVFFLFSVFQANILLWDWWRHFTHSFSHTRPTALWFGKTAALWLAGFRRSDTYRDIGLVVFFFSCFYPFL